MKEKICEYEKDLVKGLATESQNKELAVHIAQCDDCRETFKVAKLMQAFAATSQPKTLPKPGFIKWKAQLIEKQATARRAIQPIVWAQIMTVILVTITIVRMLFENQTQFASTAKVLFASLELVAAPFLIVLTCAVFICLTLAYKWREPSERK